MVLLDISLGAVVGGNPRGFDTHVGRQFICRRRSFYVALLRLTDKLFVVVKVMKLE